MGLSRFLIMGCTESNYGSIGAAVEGPEWITIRGVEGHGRMQYELYRVLVGAIKLGCVDS